MAKKSTGIPGLKVQVDSVAELRAALSLLTQREVLVGFPDSTADREDEDDQGQKVKSPITNAQLAYTHDNGAPEQNIPARPFMRESIEDNVPVLTQKLMKIGKRVLKRASLTEIEQGFNELGIAAQFAIRRKINEGIPPPLAEITLLKRAAKGRKGAKKELKLRAQGVAPSTQFAKPLIDTGQLRNAANYVVRPKRRSK